MRSVPAWRFLLPVILTVGGICAPNAVGGRDLVAAAGRPATRRSAPAAGTFLVARREMRDPNFARTVVLLLDYGAEGAMGLVINRPSHVDLSTLASEIEGLATWTDPIYAGGPVPTESLFVVFRADDPPEDSEPVFGRVHVTRSAEVLRTLVDAEEPTDLRVYSGYAGWAGGQLESEMARGDWHVVEADENSLFAGKPAEVWELVVPPEPTRQARRRSTERIRGELEPLESAGALAALESSPIGRERAGEDAEADQGVVVLVSQLDHGRRRAFRFETHATHAMIELATDSRGRHLVGQFGLGGR